MIGGRENVAALLFATMFPQIAVLMMSLAPPVMAGAIAGDLGLRPELAGLYIGVVYGGVFTGNLFCAGPISRLGPLRLSLLCVAGTACGLVLFALGGGIGLILGTILMGLFYGPLTPASAQAISHHAGSRAFGFIVSLRQTSVPMGGVLAGFLVPPLLLRYGWVETCCILAALSTVAALLFGATSPTIRYEKPSGRSARRGGLLQPMRVVLGSGPLLRLAASSMIYGAVQLVATSFLVVYLVSVGYDLVMAGVLLSASQAAGIVGRPLWGHFADRIGSPRLTLLGLGLGMAVSCLGLAALARTGPTWMAIPLVVVFGATAIGWNGVYLAALMRQADPSAAALATSGGLTFTYFGICLGPSMFSGVASLAGFVPALLLMALLSGSGSLLLLKTEGGGRPTAPSG